MIFAIDENITKELYEIKFNKDVLNKYKEINTVQKNNKNIIYKAIAYDVESDIMYQREIKYNLFDNLRGISCISIGNNLYMCGIDNSMNSFSAGSNFLVYDTVKCKLNILTNSIYNHHCPTLILYNQNMLFVLGGLNTKKCEVYDLTNNKWKTLPDLPCERYGASAYIDNVSDFLYLIGGIDTKSCSNKIDELYKNDSASNLSMPNVSSSYFFNNKYNYINADTSFMNDKSDIYIKNNKPLEYNVQNDSLSIYMLNISSNQMSWDIANIGFNYNDANSNIDYTTNMNRYFSIIISAKDSLFILGGFNNLGKPLDDIIEIDINTVTYKSKLNLHKDMTFSLCRETMNLNKGQYFFISDDMKINKLEINGFNITSSDILNNVLCL